MAVKQGTVQLQRPAGVFVTIMVFFLAHGTMVVADQAKQMDRKAEFDAWYRWFSSSSDVIQKPHDITYLYAKSCLDAMDDKNCVKQIFDSLIVDGTSRKNSGEFVGCACKIKEMGRLMCMLAVGGTTGHMNKYEADAYRINKRAHEMFLMSHRLDCPPK